MSVNNFTAGSSGYRQTRSKTNSQDPDFMPGLVSRGEKRKLPDTSVVDSISKIGETALANFDKGSSPAVTLEGCIMQAYKQERALLLNASDHKDHLPPEDRTRLEGQVSDFLEGSNRILLRYRNVLSEATAALAGGKKETTEPQISSRVSARSLDEQYFGQLSINLKEGGDHTVVVEQVLKVQKEQNDCYTEVWKLTQNAFRMRKEFGMSSDPSIISESRVLKTPEPVEVNASSAIDFGSAEKWKEGLGEGSVPVFGSDFPGVFSSP